MNHFNAGCYVLVFHRPLRRRGQCAAILNHSITNYPTNKQKTGLSCTILSIIDIMRIWLQTSLLLWEVLLNNRHDGQDKDH